jgi:2-keto-3-deoxy-L-rhamnonate aldolase RhmA
MGASSPKLIVDIEGRIIAILLGRPEDPEWDEVVRKAAAAFTRARRAGEASGAFRPQDLKHRRGSYAVLSTGVSLGGGQQVHNV